MPCYIIEHPSYEHHIRFEDPPHEHHRIYGWNAWAIGWRMMMNPEMIIMMVLMHLDGDAP
eukprot:4161217-Karenia_brevis.AAC.1